MIKKLYYILFFVFQIYFVFTNNLFADNLLSKIQKSWDNIDSFQANFRQSIQVVWGTLSKQQVRSP